MMNLSKTEKGFTLIELMIVVAIIGILAAIAIPQFSNYRTKAFNAAAISDLHTARLAEESIYADYQQYGASVAGTSMANTTGALLTTNGSAYISTDTKGQNVSISLSKGVEIVANGAKKFVAASITSKHDQGDKLYASETDQSGTYQQVSKAGTALTAKLALAATAAKLDATTAKKWSAM